MASDWSRWWHSADWLGDVHKDIKQHGDQSKRGTWSKPKRTIKRSLRKTWTNSVKRKRFLGTKKIISNVPLFESVLDLRAGPDDRVMTWNLWHLDFLSVHCDFFNLLRPILSEYYYWGESSTVSAQNNFESNVFTQMVLSVSLLLLKSTRYIEDIFNYSVASYRSRWSNRMKEFQPRGIAQLDVL